MKHYICLIFIFLFSLHIHAHCGGCGSGDFSKEDKTSSCPCKSSKKKSKRSAKNDLILLTEKEQQKVDAIMADYYMEIISLKEKYANKVSDVLKGDKLNQFLTEKELSNLSSY